ncbi:MAG: AraC family transcriptional regulator [Bacteroidota bacterium]
MRPELEKIQRNSTRSFNVKIVKRANRPLLTKAWHYHPEIEICYTVKSRGRRYVGNNISEYKEQDLVILGPNLPHGFTTSVETEQYVLQFRKEFLGQGFFNAAELERINNLLIRSKRGLSLSGMEIKEADHRIRNIYNQEEYSFQKLLSLLEFLDYLSTCKNLSPICTEKYSSHISITKLNSIKTIFEFIENNFQKQVTISDACKMVNLTESAFYKFVKRHTNKKFTTILNEYRIDHASKLLISSDLPISEICYQSGFGNLSHFNRVFKQSFNITPRELRRKYEIPLK